jgi:hypothetical protein
MAGRIRNRRELRDQADQAERQRAEVPDAATGAAATPEGGKAKAKRTAAPKARKPRAKKAPPRFCARWGLFDGGLKLVAIFDYNRRDAAEAKLAELLGRKKGIFFMQIVKEPMPEPAAEEMPAAG